MLAQESGAGSTVDARYRYTNYKDSDMFPTNSERTGSSYQVGISHQRPLTAIATVRGGYAFDMDRANSGDSWDYNGHQVSLGIKFPLPYDVQLDVSSDVHWRTYVGEGSYASYKRNDMSWTSNVMLVKVISSQCSVSAGFFVDRTYSNVPVFDYSRSITSLLFTMRF
jgi:hypothetical protein